MGSFNLKCGVTNTVIDDMYRNEIALLILEKVEYRNESDIIIYPNDVFKLTPYIIKGKYDGYGTLDVDTIEYDNHFKSFLIEAIHEVEQKGNMKPSVGLRGSELEKVARLKDKDYEKDILESTKLSDIKYITEEDVKALLNPYYKMGIHLDVYNKLMEYDFGNDGYELETVKPFLGFIHNYNQKLKNYRGKDGYTKQEELGILTYYGNNLLEAVGEHDEYSITQIYSAEDKTNKDIDEILKEYVNDNYTRRNLREDRHTIDLHFRGIRNSGNIYTVSETFEDSYNILKNMYTLNEAFHNIETLIAPSMYSGDNGTDGVLYELIKEAEYKSRICWECEKHEDECGCESWEE